MNKMNIHILLGKADSWAESSVASMQSTFLVGRLRMTPTGMYDPRNGSGIMTSKQRRDVVLTS